MKRDWLVPLGVYAVGVLLCMGHALLSGGALVVGHPESDVWKHLWGAWWMKENLFSGRFPYETDLQNFPEGGRLFVIDPLNTALSAPLQPLVGLPQAYNLVMAFQLLAAAFCAFLLARRLTGDPRAAMVAGAAYGFSPFLLTSGLSSGIAETANLAWLPLALLGLLECLTRGSRVGMACASLGLLLAALGSWYYGMVTGVTVLLLFGWTLWKGPPVPEAPATVGWRPALVACLLAAVLALPFAVLFFRSLKGEGSLLARIDVTERLQESSLEFLHRHENFKNDADVLGYFAPGKSRISMADDVDRRMKSVYAGLLVWGLALYGAWRGGRWTRFWAACALVMLVLSLGPFMYVAPGVGLPGPRSPLYMLFYYGLPGFRLIAIADRISIACQVSLAVLAAAGLSRLLPEGRRGWGVAGVVSALVLLEVAVLSPVPWPLPVASTEVPAAVRALAAEPRYGLLELPLNRVQQTLQPGEFYYWQTVHGKPIPITLTTRFPLGMMENRLVGTLYLVESADYGDPPPPSALEPGLRALQEQGFRAVLVHAPLMTPRAAAGVEAVLTALLGRPERFEDGRLLYRIPAP